MSFHPAYGRGTQRVIRPRVFWITTAELLAHLVVAGCPEVGQILGHLYGASGRRKQMQQDRRAALSECRGLETSEHLLHAYGKNGSLVRLVVDPYPRAAGNGE